MGMDYKTSFPYPEEDQYSPMSNPHMIFDIWLASIFPSLPMQTVGRFALIPSNL